jgi:hypothetical protein
MREVPAALVVVVVEEVVAVVVAMEVIEVVAVADMEEIAAATEEEAVAVDSVQAVVVAVSVVDLPNNVVGVDGEEVVVVTVVEEALEEAAAAAAVVDTVVVAAVDMVVEVIGEEEDVTLAAVEASVEAWEVAEAVEVAFREVVATARRRTPSATMVMSAPTLALSKSCFIPTSRRLQASTSTSMTTFPSKLVQDAPTHFSNSRWSRWVRSC